MFSFLFTFVILSCVSDSWQKCFHNHCAHHSPLSDCVSGDYTCAADEFCETITHIPHNSHSNEPWVVMECRPNAVIADCQALHSSNDPACDPNKHDLRCHWCCQTEQCMKDLAQGILPSTSLPLTTTSLPTTTTPSPTQTMMPVDTTSAVVCEDTYLGDCATDYAGRCSEPLIMQLCAKTCGLC